MRSLVRVAALAALSLTLGVGLLPAPASAAPAVGTVQGADGPGAIAGRYIVVLASGVDVDGTALVAPYGGTVQEAYTASLKGFAVSMSAGQAARLAEGPVRDEVSAALERRLAEIL